GIEDIVIYVNLRQFLFVFVFQPLQVVDIGQTEFFKGPEGVPRLDNQLVSASFQIFDRPANILHHDHFAGGQIVGEFDQARNDASPEIIVVSADRQTFVLVQMIFHQL